MGNIIEAVSKFPLWLILAFVASIILIFSLYEISLSDGSFSIKPLDPPYLYGILTATVIYALSFILIAAPFLVSSKPPILLFSKTKNSVKIGKINVQVSFGKIQNMNATDLTILSANEFFDDVCINDPKSALGAYFLAKIPGKSGAVLSAIRSYLEGTPEIIGSPAKNSTDKDVLTYEIGTVVPVRGIAGLTEHIALVSVTTHRKGESLMAREEYIFAAIQGISDYCDKNRLQTVKLPLIGSGHGKITHRTSLLSILLAIGSLSDKCAISSLEIVVYKEEQSDPKFPAIEVSQILEMACWLQEKS